MIKIFGHFQDIIDKKSTEYLNLSFSPSSLSLKERWVNNGLSADFLGDYFTIFFPKNVEENQGYSKREEIKSTVSYIANELLENAMKFSKENSDYPISIRLDLDVNKLTFWLVNSVAKEGAQNYQNFIEELLSNDPQELYFQYLERNAENELEHLSGLGIITMINDYQAQMGWKFEIIEDVEDSFQVTTMVELGI